MRRTLKGGAIVAAVLIPAIIAMRLARPVSAGALADSGSTMQGLSGTSSALAEVLSRSCGDCHSNVMLSRWYSRVPPFSTLMARGAREGRKAINFSEWGTTRQSSSERS